MAFACMMLLTFWCFMFKAVVVWANSFMYTPWVLTAFILMLYCDKSKHNLNIVSLHVCAYE